MPKTTDDRPADIGPHAGAGSEQLARQQAIKRIRARRRFKISTASAGVGVTLLVPIWAATEYRNAGGWPARGFSQRSGTPGVRYIWIIYPFLAYALITAGHGWLVYGRKPGFREQDQTRDRATGPGAAQTPGERPLPPAGVCFPVTCLSALARHDAGPGPAQRTQRLLRIPAGRPVRG